MKKLLLAVSALAISAASASAADLAARPYTKAPPPVVAPVSDWTGFYIGVNGGYGWQANSDTINYFYASTPGVVQNSGPGFNDKGGFGGGQLGYNWQAGKFVFGLETDIQGADITSSFRQFPAPGASCCGNPADIFAGNSKLTWFGTVRGRAGVAFDNLLLYGTAGFAYGRIEQSINATNPAFAPPLLFFNTAYADTRTGWVAGAGAEYKITRNWSAKVEYQYLDFGSSALAGVNAGNGPDFTNSVRHQFHTVRFGINYLFGGPVVAKY